MSVAFATGIFHLKDYKKLKISNIINLQ